MRTRRRWAGIPAAAVALACLVSGGRPQPARAQGWIEPSPAARNGFAVTRVRSEVHVTVEGRVARVEVREWFRNDGRRMAEGHYLYPLPGEAVFRGFSLWQGETELRGEIMDAERARAVYEEIVRRRMDPALIELAGEGLLRARVFPIQPGEERRVALRYTQLLEQAGGSLQFRYAGSVAGTATGSVAGTATGPVAGGGAPRPRPIPADEPFEAPRRFTGDAGSSLTLEVDDGAAFLDPFSPTHALEVTRPDGHLRVRVADPVEGRVSIFLPPARDAVALSVAAHRPAGEDGYVMLTLSPGRGDGPVLPRDVTVVMDVSGSMSGEKIAQAKAALVSLLGSLSAQDRFRLVSFSSTVRPETTGWRRARAEDLALARGWVERLVADGGTNLEAALEEALRLPSPSERLPVVLFLTDGLPSVGEQSPERLADRAEARVGRARIFAFGVGHDVNTHLLDRLGEAGRGSTEYVEPGESVERAIGLVAARISRPVLTDLEIEEAPVRLGEVYPVRLPDLFSGEDLVVFARYRGAGRGPVRVRGRRGREVVRFEVDAVFPERADGDAWMPRLWASRKLGHLMRQVWTEGESEGLLASIREVALRYGLPSPYTSYLVEDEAAVASLPGRRLDAVAPAAGAPAEAAWGKVAVRRAEAARELRQSASVAALAAAEDALTADAAARPGTTIVAGRLFRDEAGVWVEAGPRADRTVAVRPFSPAWFDVLQALPELKPVLRAWTRVRVHGAGVDLVVDAGGSERLDAASLDALVRRFRGG